MNRKQQLTDRIANLEKLKAEELALKQPSQGFISDVNETLKACKVELSYMNKNPGKGFEMVNGV